MNSFFKPRKIEERLIVLKPEVDANIVFDNNTLTYTGDIYNIQLEVLTKFYQNYTINVRGDVYLNNIGIKKLPLQFGKVEGFFCSGNRLESLKGCPIYVKNNFICVNKTKISLEDCPSYVGGNFLCCSSRTKFTELEIRNLCEVIGKISSFKKTI